MYGHPEIFFKFCFFCPILPLRAVNHSTLMVVSSSKFDFVNFRCSLETYITAIYSVLSELPNCLQF